MNTLTEGSTLTRDVTQNASVEYERPAALPSGPAATSPASATSLLSAITQAACNPQVDMDKMERLFAMHREMVRWEREAAFNDAMARAQSRIMPVVKNCWNDHTKSMFANLAAINAQIVPLYTAEGLSLSYDTETVNAADPIPAGYIRIVAFVGHAAGHTKKYHIDLALDDAGVNGTKNKTKVQAAGSTNSFGRRYLALMIFNVSTGDDTDGNGQKEGDGQGGPTGSGSEGTEEPPPKPAYTNEAITANLPSWKELVAAGKKTSERIISQLGMRYTLTVEQSKRITDALPVAKESK